MTRAELQRPEADKLRSQLAACAIHAAGDSCLACDAIRDRLRLLEAPALDLDALPVTVPPEHQALSFGRLATPERNHACPACHGVGKLACEGIGFACCPRCAGSGERRADREPADHAFPDNSDRAIRRRLSSARDAGLVGAAEKRGGQ